MFGIGGSEILVILVVALLFLGPDKLPDAAKTISKGIRDLKKQSRALQEQIESDEKIGGAIRDLKSALRGDELHVRPPVRVQPPPLPPNPDNTEAPALEEPKHTVTLPELAGEPAAAEPEMEPPSSDEPSQELGSLVKPAPGTVAKNG